uniref:C2 domain-containing protein n=1 Tax=Globodera rostochiensis TaxID=31243 RepID=A0A914I820_GLORO
MDDLENDEELLAELLSLQVPLDEPGPHRNLASNVTPDVNDGIPVEETQQGEDMDVDDEDLLNELSELTGPCEEPSPTTKREFQTGPINGNELGQTLALRNVSPKRMKTLNEVESAPIEQERIPIDPTIELPKGPPPIPVRTASISLPEKVEFAKQSMQKPVLVETTEKTIESETLLENRAKNLLNRRRKLYLDRSLAAKQANDRPAAIEAFETVKMFNHALQAIGEGAQLSEEDLRQIPPSPQPYKSASAKNSTIKQQPTKDLPSSAVVSDKNYLIANAPMSEDLKLVLTRQLLLKKEAIAAKQNGDLNAAKEFLSLALRMDQMVEAAKCGVPIDVQQLPELHSNTKALPKAATKMGTIDEQTLPMKKCNLLEKELIKQIDLCEEKASKFQSAGDSKNTLLYEGLLQQSKKDLQRVQRATLGQAQLPGFKLFDLSLPVIELNSSIPDDKLELKIRKVEHLKLPEGWKPSDCALYVFYKFPFPHGNHQTGRTSTVKGTISPEFSDVFLLDINRKTKQLLRICKRQPMKLEGGFLRSDKLFACADVSLQELEKSATICSLFPMLEGRKKTGGNVQVEIHIKRPLGDAFDATTNAKRKWVKLDN